MRAIVQILGERLLEQIRSDTMELKELPKSEGFKRFERTLHGGGRVAGKAEGKAEGLVVGKAEGLRVAVADLCELLGIAPTTARRRQLAALDLEGLEALRAQLKQQRAWPAGR